MPRTRASTPWSRSSADPARVAARRRPQARPLGIGEVEVVPPDRTPPLRDGQRSQERLGDATGSQPLDEPAHPKHVAAHDPLQPLALGLNLLDTPDAVTALIDHHTSEEPLDAHFGAHRPPGSRASTRSASQRSKLQAGVRAASTSTRTSLATAITASFGIRVARARLARGRSQRETQSGSRPRRVAAPTSSATTRGGASPRTSSTMPSTL